MGSGCMVALCSSGSEYWPKRRVMVTHCGTIRVRRHDMDQGCVCYAKADGSTCREVIRAMMTPNGVGLSPDGTRLYVAETIPGRVWGWEITAPGQTRIERTGTANRGHLLVGVPGYQEFDSLAVDSAGYVCVATLHNGGITMISPDGSRVQHIPMPDLLRRCRSPHGLHHAFPNGPPRRDALATSWPGIALPEPMSSPPPPLRPGDDCGERGLAQ
jgi:hypothetical protein